MKKLDWSRSEEKTTSRADRQELYKDRDTQMLLNKFLSGELQNVEPVFDSKRGYRYESIETIVGGASRTVSFLEKLFEAGILERELHDEVIFCSKCNSANISTRYCCPYCKSFNIKKSSLIEHVKCGYMDVEEEFHKGDKLICQKCHDELRKLDVDYRRAGIWCTCKECGKSFDVPVVRMFCRDCHNEFAFEDATIHAVYRYSLKEDARREAAEGCVLIPPISEFLTANGFEVRSPAYLKGKSGANHVFDIVASKKDTKSLTVIDLATSPDNLVSEQPVIALFAKIFDVSPHAAFLIAIPKLNDNAKKMAELYNIHAVEGKNQKEAMDRLKEKIAQAKAKS